MRDAVDATGLEGGYRQGLLNAAGGVETAVDFLPVVGDALAVEDASRAYGQGDMVGAGINMMGVVPFVGDVVAKGAKSALRGLDMNPEARMQRASDQGYLPETVYHGTAADITEFKPRQYGGSVTKANSAKMGTWFSDNPDVSAGYAKMAGEDMPVQVLIDASNKAERAGQWDKANELMGQAEKLEQSGVLIDGGGQNIMPARIRGNLFEIDAEGATMGDLDDSQLYKWSREAKKQGFDGLKIKNFSDNADYGTYTPANHYLIFDPKNIRSTNAEFDPTKADSSDLLSSVGATSALRGIV